MAKTFGLAIMPIRAARIPQSQRTGRLDGETVRKKKKKRQIPQEEAPLL